MKRGYYLSAEYLIGRHMQMLKSKCAGDGQDDDQHHNCRVGEMGETW